MRATLLRAAIDRVRNRSDGIPCEEDQRSIEALEYLYSQTDVERALSCYLTDAERATWEVRVRAWPEIYGWYPEDDGSLADDTWAPDSLRLDAPPRTRNVFGDRLSWPSRGRMDGRPLPRATGRRSDLLIQRADVQRAMHRVPRRSAEVAFLRAVADMEFKDIARMYSISTQAAHKAYRKALGDLQIALNGEPLVAHGRGRRMYLQELQRRLDALTSASDLTYLRAELGYWERRAKRMRNRLETLYGNLPRLEADAERERHLDVAA